MSFRIAIWKYYNKNYSGYNLTCINEVVDIFVCFFNKEIKYKNIIELKLDKPNENCLKTINCFKEFEYFRNLKIIVRENFEQNWVVTEIDKDLKIEVSVNLKNEIISVLNKYKSGKNDISFGVDPLFILW